MSHVELEHVAAAYTYSFRVTAKGRRSRILSIIKLLNESKPFSFPAHRNAIELERTTELGQGKSQTITETLRILSGDPCDDMLYWLYYRKARLLSDAYRTRFVTVRLASDSHLEILNKIGSETQDLPRLDVNIYLTARKSRSDEMFSPILTLTVLHSFKWLWGD